MLRLEEAFPWLPSRDCYVSLKHEADKVLVFDRGTAAGPLLFHPLTNEASTAISVADFVKFIAATGHSYTEVDFAA